MVPNKFTYCGKDKHKFGDPIPCGSPIITNKRECYGFQRGKMECKERLCAKIVELKRAIWVDSVGKVVRVGKWQRAENID